MISSCELLLWPALAISSCGQPCCCTCRCARCVCGRGMAIHSAILEEGRRQVISFVGVCGWGVAVPIWCLRDLEGVGHQAGSLLGLEGLGSGLRWCAWALAGSCPRPALAAALGAPSNGTWEERPRGWN